MCSVQHRRTLGRRFHSLYQMLWRIWNQTRSASFGSILFYTIPFCSIASCELNFAITTINRIMLLFEQWIKLEAVCVCTCACACDAKGISLFDVIAFWVTGMRSNIYLTIGCSMRPIIGITGITVRHTTKKPHFPLRYQHTQTRLPSTKIFAICLTFCFSLTVFVYLPTAFFSSSLSLVPHIPFHFHFRVFSTIFWQDAKYFFGLISFRIELALNYERHIYLRITVLCYWKLCFHENNKFSFRPNTISNQIKYITHQIVIL